MIGRETLEKIARLYGLRPWQQERHYVQALMLGALSEFPLVFKGGTYLWFFHGLDRFSEDLDFTATGDLPEEIGNQVSESLRMFGVENSLKAISDDERSLSFRISAKGPLNTSERNLTYVYVEVSRRERVMQPPLSLELKFDAYALPVKIVGGMALDELAAEKVRAVCTREKARDAYDLHYLITRKGVKFDRSIAGEKLKYYGLPFSEELLSKSLRKREKDWKPELKSLVLGKLPEFESVFSTIIGWVKG